MNDEVEQQSPPPNPRRFFVVKRSNFLLGHNEPQRMVRSEWDRGENTSIIYVIYRLFLLIYFLCWYIARIVYAKDILPYYFIYLTDWNFTIFMLHQLYNTAMVVCHWLKIIKFQPGHMSLWLKIHWALYNIALVLSVTICLLFWVLVYSTKMGPPDAFNLHEHLFVGLAMLIDLSITAVPIRLSHVWIVQVVAFIYGIFTVIYYLAGGVDPWGHRYIYPVIDYGNKTTVAVLCVLLLPLIGVPLIHAAMYGLHRLRRFLAQKCGRDRVSPVQENST